MAQFIVKSSLPFAALPGFETSGVKFAMSASFAFASGPRNLSIKSFARFETAGSGWTRRRWMFAGPRTVGGITSVSSAVSNAAAQVVRLSS